MERMASQVRNHNSHNHEESHLERALVYTFKKTVNCHSQQMIQHPTQPSSIELEMANVCKILSMRQDDDHADWEINDNESEDL